MNFTSDELKAMVAGYFRYKRACSLIAFEASDKCKWSSGEPADVLAVTNNRMLYEIEVKISLSDLKNDIKKNKHQLITRFPGELLIRQFYFALPNDLINKAKDICDELYPYAGILSVSKFPFISAAYDFGVSSIKEASILSTRKLPLREILVMVREQSGTICRLARDQALAEREKLKMKDELMETNKLLKLANITK